MNEQAIKQCKSILKKNHLHPLRRIGKGAFATVFLVEKIQLQKNQNQLYSVKCINKKQIIKRPSLNKYIKQEIEILRNIKNEHIVRSYRTFQDDGWIFMVMEYCDKGNLNSKVTETQGSVLTLQETFHITNQIIHGLDYMHTKNLIHRDIKAENILLSSKDKSKTKVSSKKILALNNTIASNYDYIIKICDLGFTTQQDQSVNTFCGTTCYMAPQIFKKANYDNKVDIWALGVLIYFMLFGSFPFQGLNIEYQIQKKCQKGFNLSQMNVKLNQSISKQNFKLLEDFFRKIFVSNPQARMTLEELKATPWIKKSNNLSNPGNANNIINTVTNTLTNTIQTQKRERQKTRIETEKQQKSTANESDQSEDQIKNKRNFDIQKYYFVKDIIEEVQIHKFLKSSQEIAFRYYMLKMIYHEFAKVLKVSNLKEQLDKLQSTLQNSSKMLVNNIKKINIPKLGNLFNPKAKQFNQFKQPYRLVIGHVFSKAHKNITQNIQLRSQLKLKLFICHVINRVFQIQQNQGIFVHYEKWSKQKKVKNFSFKTFSKWICQEQGQKLVETIQLMNSKFYKSK